MVVLILPVEAIPSYVNSRDTKAELLQRKSTDFSTKDVGLRLEK